MAAAPSDDHPLALELTSLRTAVARFQEEAHTSSLKLQHHTLQVSQAHERAQYFERENARLHQEITILRAHPHLSNAPRDPFALQTTINQLTLALRSISDKLDLTESALLTRTTELAHAMGNMEQIKLELEGAYNLAEETRASEEKGLVREKELQGKVRAAEEQRKLSDLVVLEYADLVRSLEGRPNVRAGSQDHSWSNPAHENGQLNDLVGRSTPRLVDGLSEGKIGLQKLFSEFNSETTHLHSEIDRLTCDLAVSFTKYDAQMKSAERDRDELAKAKFELEKLRMDDGTAAKMVSRYMKFSQQTANDLQSSLSTLTARHVSTLSTLSYTIQALQESLSREKRTSEQLRAALDELTADIAREVYGRRREVALRLRLVERDERLGEGVRRLARRVEEGLSKMNGGEGEVGVRKVLEKFVREAKGLLDSLDGSLEGPLAQSALGRIIVAESAVKMLARELQVETEKRLRLERLAAVAVRDPWGENATEQDEEPKTPVATSDERTDTSRLWAVPGSDNAVLRSVENANGSSSSTAGDNPLDVCGDSSSGGASSSHIVQSLDQGDTSSTYTDTPRGPADCDFKPDGNLAMNEKVLSANTAAEPTDPNIPYVAESPVPDSTMVSSASSPLLSTESLTANPDYQTDVIQEGDLPPIAASLSRNLDEPHLSPAQAIVASADTLAPRFPPNLTVTVDIATNSCPPSASSPAPNVTVDLGDSVVSLPTQSVLLLKHPLLPELSSVRIRYDCLERAFRDCHLTLQDLKRYLRSPPLAAPSASSQAPPISPAIAVPVLQMAIERLDDYTEDARVELEIRAADEALLIRGFETLLSIPGALASAITPVHATSDGEDCRRPEQAEVERDIRAFVDGTDISVAKAMQLFTKKLDDIQHDIAAIKGAVYSPALDSVPHLVPGDPFTPSTSPLSSSTSWSSWTAGILGSGSRLASPAPTFGNVMTTPRLRHTLSLNFYGNGHRHDKSVDLDIDGTGDPLASLGLRVPMPAYVPVSPVRPSVRPSTLSAMYMLGLGSGGAGAPLSGVAMGSGREETDGKGVEGDDVDSGVE